MKTRQRIIRIPISVRLPEKLVQSLHRDAADQYSSITQVLIQILQKHYRTDLATPEIPALPQPSWPEEDAIDDEYGDIVDKD